MMSLKVRLSLLTIGGGVLAGATAAIQAFAS
jgi:hypothetical protein